MNRRVGGPRSGQEAKRTIRAFAGNRTCVSSSYSRFAYSAVPLIRSIYSHIRAYQIILQGN
jgi:hypothetical protein